MAEETGTNIRVSDEAWKKINSFKRVGESFDDVLMRVKFVEEAD